MKLKQAEGLKLYGRWRLTARHIKTGESIIKEGEQTLLPENLAPPWRCKMTQGDKPDLVVIEGENLIVSTGKYLVGQMLIDVSGYDTGLTYCAIGTGATAPVVGDTKLTTESARLAITSKTRVTNVITLSTFFTAAQSTYNIKEAGIFGHSTASGSADTGQLFSHWLVSFDNSGGTYDITIDYILTIG